MVRKTTLRVFKLLYDVATRKECWYETVKIQCFFIHGISVYIFWCNKITDHYNVVYIDNLENRIKKGYVPSHSISVNRIGLL